MPHLIMEYSENLTSSLNIQALLRALHSTAEASGLFQAATIRTRGVPCVNYVVGEGTEHDAFIHLEARIRPGRTDELQWKLVQSLMSTLRDAVAEAQSSGLRIGLTVEATLISPIRVLYSTLDPSGYIMELNGPPS